MSITKLNLDRQANARVFSFGTTSASGEALVTINKGTAATSTVVADIKGSVNIGGDLNLTGNLNITGTINEQSVTNLQVADINITLNKGGTTAGAAGAGLFVEGDSAATIGKLLFDNTLTSKWKIGDGTTQVEVVTISGAQTLTNKSIAGTQITGNISGNAANVTGTVLVANGGTGAVTLTGVLKGNGTSAISAATAGTDFVVAGTVTVGKIILAAAAAGGASLQITAQTGTPSSPASGDVWNNAGVLKFYNGSTTKDIAFTDGNITGSAASVTNALTFNNGGSGDASGTTFNGSAAKTLSYNSIGAAPLASPTFTGTVVIPTGASITLPNFSTSATVSAAGTTQGTGTALTSDINIITTVGASAGVVLPATTAGKRVVVVNKGANALTIYPATSSAIDALSANVGVSLAVGGVLEFNGASTTQWYSNLNTAVAGAYVTGNITGSAGSVSSALSIGAELISGGATTYNGSAAKTIGIQPTSVTNAMLAGSIDLTTKVTGILPGANGGTGNGFTAFSGPTTSLKTFTLPNASAAILTDNAAVTVAQGGTGIVTTTAYGVIHAGTTATGAFQNSGTPGASGTVYTSTGPTSLPTWQTAGAPSLYFRRISISGTQNGSNKAFTYSGSDPLTGTDMVTLNGDVLYPSSSLNGGNDYFLDTSTNTITFDTNFDAPVSTDSILFWGVV